MIAAGLDADIARQVAAAFVALPSRADEAAIERELRAAFPELRIVVCSDEQIPPRLSPALVADGCALYYLDAGEHCVKLTDNREVACGIVVGLVDDD